MIVSCTLCMQDSRPRETCFRCQRVMSLSILSAHVQACDGDADHLGAGMYFLYCTNSSQIIFHAGLSSTQRPISNLPGLSGTQRPISNLPGVSGTRRPISNLPGVSGTQQPISNLPGVSGTQRPISNLPGPSGTQQPIVDLTEPTRFHTDSDSSTSDEMPILPPSLHSKAGMLVEMFPNYTTDQVDLAVSLCTNDAELA